MAVGRDKATRVGAATSRSSAWLVDSVDRERVGAFWLPVAAALPAPDPMAGATLAVLSPTTLGRGGAVRARGWRALWRRDAANRRYARGRSGAAGCVGGSGA